MLRLPSLWTAGWLLLCSALVSMPAAAESPARQGLHRQARPSVAENQALRGEGSVGGRGVPDVPDTLATRGPGDGVYGRFAGDLSLSLAAGVAWDGFTNQLHPGVLLASRIYQSVGVYGSFWQSVSSEPALVRWAEAGILLEPLFLLRWSADRQWGHAFWDLTLDSLSVSLGVALAEPALSDWGDQTGLAAGLGWGVPLFGRAPGPWLRFRGGVQTGGPELSATARLHLEWQWFFTTGVLER